MAYNPSDEQQAVINSQAPITVVLGGAGAGKTTTAAAAAAQRLAVLDERRAAIRRATPFGVRAVLPARKRVLFMSFSKTAVSQIIDRSASVLGAQRNRIDVVTFHGLAWRILNDFGRHYGIAHPVRVRSQAETDLGIATAGLSYAELMPAAQQVLRVPAVASYYQDRYAVVICDEFQDTSDAEWAFMQDIAPSARRILLGDANQCIYAGMKKIDPALRVAGALAQPGAEQIVLPPRSFRDPSGVLPAAAQAALERQFSHPAITEAVLGRRLVVHRTQASDAAAEVISTIAGERAAGNTVCVFTHTHAATSDLSALLTEGAINHEQVGFSEALGNALQAQFMLLRWALTGATGGREALAVYVKSILRGRQAKDVADAILRKSHAPLEEALKGVTGDLHACTSPSLDLERVHHVLLSAHKRLGFPRDVETWDLAGQYLRRAARALESGRGIEAVEDEIARLRADTLVGLASSRAKPVQVMNLHQTKGREADATVLLLQEDEYHGREQEPFPTGSRLLYVCLTRARQTAHVIVPDVVHPLWLPLVNACIEIGNSADG